MARIGVADGVTRAGVGDAGSQVYLNFVILGQFLAGGVAEFFDVQAFVGGSGEAVIDPEEGADFSFAARGEDLFGAVGSQLHYFAGAQFSYGAVAEVKEGGRFHRNGAGAVFFAQNHGRSSIIVSGGVEAVFSQKHKRAGAVDPFVEVLDAVHEALAFVDKDGDEFGHVYFAQGRFREMHGVALADFLDELLGVVYDADGDDGVFAQVRPYDQRLSVEVTDDAHSHVSGEGV